MRTTRQCGIEPGQSAPARRTHGRQRVRRGESQRVAEAGLRASGQDKRTGTDELADWRLERPWLAAAALPVPSEGPKP
jgi:hypothetical protein